MYKKLILTIPYPMNENTSIKLARLCALYTYFCYGFVGVML